MPVDAAKVERRRKANYSYEEWNKTYLNHANLHLSFLVPQ